MPKTPRETVLIDSREQLPYVWEDRPTLRETLDVGDYSGASVRDDLRIERKELSDLLRCVGAERARFERCLARLEFYRWRYLLIEASLDELARGEWREGRFPSKVTPSQVIGSVFSWSLRYRVQPLFCVDRAHGSAAVARIADLAAKAKRKEGAATLQ